MTRKTLAGALIRLAHRIYPPQVTEEPPPPAITDLRIATDRELLAEGMTHPDPKAAGRAMGELNRRRNVLMNQARR